MASRPNPKFDLGNVDWSAAIILCDTLVEDTPIVYCSDAFEKLTGYGKHEAVGRNCRFLQERRQSLPVSKSEVQMSARTHARSQDDTPDETTVFGNESHKWDEEGEILRLRSALSRRQEVQATLRNYKKCGSAFMNLLTIIPIRWDSESDQYRYLVGFQADRDALRG